MQPHVMLLKTNYFDVERYTAQAKALKDTIKWFEAVRAETSVWRHFMAGYN